MSKGERCCVLNELTGKTRIYIALIHLDPLLIVISEAAYTMLSTLEVGEVPNPVDIYQSSGPYKKRCCRNGDLRADTVVSYLWAIATSVAQRDPPGLAVSLIGTKVPRRAGSPSTAIELIPLSPFVRTALGSRYPELLPLEGRPI